MTSASCGARQIMQSAHTQSTPDSGEVAGRRLYRFCKHLMADVDLELAQRMRELPRAEHAPDMRPGTGEVRTDALADMPGISTLTAHTVLMEVGTDLSRFRNASASHPGWDSVQRSRSWPARCFVPERLSSLRLRPPAAQPSGHELWRVYYNTERPHSSSFSHSRPVSSEPSALRGARCAVPGPCPPASLPCSARR